jgi:hypothetical protein
VKDKALPVLGRGSANMSFEAFQAVKISWTVGFHVMTPCSLVGSYQHFEGTYCLHLQGRSED